MIQDTRLIIENSETYIRARRGFAPGFVNYKKGALDSQIMRMCILAEQDLQCTLQKKQRH